jgi:hypothetical protein
MLADNPKWKKYKGQTAKTIGWFIHLPGWFAHHAEEIAGQGTFSHLPDSVAKIGLAAVENRQVEVAKDAMSAISSIASAIMKKEKGPQYGYTEPRVMEKVCYIGILALKFGTPETVEFAKPKIAEFEKEYSDKWFAGVSAEEQRSSPSQDQLKWELFELIQDCNKRPQQAAFAIMDDARDRLIRLIVAEDVNRFSKAIWGYRISERFRTSRPF